MFGWPPALRALQISVTHVEPDQATRTVHVRARRVWEIAGSFQLLHADCALALQVFEIVS